jgi:hypothetical protein
MVAVMSGIGVALPMWHTSAWDMGTPALGGTGRVVLICVGPGESMVLPTYPAMADVAQLAAGEDERGQPTQASHVLSLVRTKCECARNRLQSGQLLQAGQEKPARG